MLKERYYTEPTEVDQLIFAKLVPPEHSLRQVKRLIDFERFRALVADCYSPALGRSAADPVRLIKLEFLQFHYTLSDRDVIATAQVNVAFQFFLDLSLESRLPVPSLLSHSHPFGVDRQQALFYQVVTQARAQGLIRDRLRLELPRMSSRTSPSRPPSAWSPRPGSACWPRPARMPQSGSPSRPSRPNACGCDPFP